MGHTLEECDNCIHGLDKVEYGWWMVATRRSLPSNQFNQNNYSNPSRNKGARRGRGGGARGARTTNGAVTGARKRSSQEAGMSDDENLDDTAESPMKTDPMEQAKEQPPPAESSAKKRLDLSGVTCGSPSEPTGQESA
ncbi:hypothetical protein D1007_03067 [Hordeum vulgare]|nr:hypothetical protein D1007_03067 [Hordeum vulgare]